MVRVMFVIVASLVLFHTACGNTPDQQVRADKDGGRNLVEPSRDDSIRKPREKRDPSTKIKDREQQLAYWQEKIIKLDKDAEGLSAKKLYILSKRLPRDELDRLLNDLPASKNTLLAYLGKKRKRCT